MSNQPPPTKIQTTAGGIIRIWEEHMSLETPVLTATLALSADDEVKLRDALSERIAARGE